MGIVFVRRNNRIAHFRTDTSGRSGFCLETSAVLAARTRIGAYGTEQGAQRRMDSEWIGTRRRNYEKRLASFSI